MNDYIVSARKYRPATFQTVVGQRALTTTLKNAISSNKLAHAYLFCGPRGVGKTTCARIFAKTINCLNITPEWEACNECESCIAFNEQRSYNIHELDAASNNSVDDIRSLIEQVRIPPQIGKYKVYIIDEVHMLSQSAFNAFLKTLEEPPHHAVFVLATTEKHKMLATILSRCQVYDFSRISLSDIIEHLAYVAKQEGVNAEQEALAIIAQKADGGMRDALSIFDQTVSFTGGNITYKTVIDNLNVLDYEYYFKLTDAILRGNVLDSLVILDDIISRGFERQSIITGLSSHFRDLMISKDSSTAKLFQSGPTIGERYVKMAEQCSTTFLYKAIELSNSCDLSYRQSKNKRLLIELTLIKLCQLSGNGTNDTGTTPENNESTIKKITVSAPSNTDEKKDSRTKEAETKSEPKKDNSSYKREEEKPQSGLVAESTSQTTTPKQTPIEHKPKEEQPQTTTQTKANISSLENIGFSISSIGNEKKKNIESEGKSKSLSKNNIITNNFTEEQLIEAWKSYTRSLTEEKLLKNTMQLATPQITTFPSFDVIANTQITKEYLENREHDIISFLREELKNDSIKMTVSISEAPQKKAFTKNEIAGEMLKENSALGKLIEELGLELN